MPRLNQRDQATAIIDKVDAKERDLHDLHTRFEDDYSLYRLDQFLPTDDETVDENLGYKIYTSSSPQTFADKIMSWLSSAELLYRIEEHTQKLHERQIDNQKEEFFYGVLRAADERLLNKVQPVARDQMGFYCTVRGIVAGRALLMDVNGQTMADLTPWDPLHTFYEVNGEGLEWACYKIRKTKQEIMAQYGVTVEVDGSGSGGNPTNQGVDVYDYYDGTKNFIFTQNDVLKKPTPHGSPRVPIFIAVLGTVPLIQSEKTTDTIKDFGESVFKNVRGVYANFNHIMSIALELTSRARKPPIAMKSQSGKKEVPDDIYKTGATVRLAQGDEITTLEMLEMTRDAGAFIGIVSGEIQRGSLPFSAYGEIAFQLSGFAITQLRQGIDTVIQPRLQLLQNAYSQIGRLFADQYATGRYDPFTVSGYDRHRKYFSLDATPEMIAQGCEATVELVGDLPQDDMSNVAMAQMLREGDAPLLPDRYIWDHVLKLQNTDRIADTLKEQMGERGAPLAILYNLMVAAQNQDRADLAQIYLGEIQELLLRKQIEIQQLFAISGQQAPAGPGGNGASPGGPPTADPRAAPNPVLGAPPPIPTPQAGPLVPPGSPRPGARSEQSRLTNIGLVGPGG